FTYRPVRVAVERLEPRGAGAQPIAAQEFPGGKFVFPEIAEGRGWLYGKVTWDEGDDERLKQTAIVRGYVNGFQQVPAKLNDSEAGARERTFRTEVLLNHGGENHIALVLPELEQDACSCTQFNMNCKQPVRAQRLHLLAVSRQDQDPEQLQ